MATDFARKVNCYRTVSINARTRRIRLWLVFGAAIIWSAVLLTRLASLQITDFERWQEWALRQHFAQVKLASERGPIYDREERILAVSIPAGSVYVRPRQVREPRQTAEILSQILDMPPSAVLSKLIENKPFVWIKRQLPRALADKIRALSLPGIDYVMEARRMYPYGISGSPLVGKVGIDGTGLSGLEALYEDLLHGGEISTTARRDALGQFIEHNPTDENFVLPKGSALRLTLDAGLQVIMDEELELGRAAANAKAAMALMLDAESGEILAMAQAPGSDPNRETSGAALRNLLVETVFEPGSILKPIVAAAALEERVVKAKEVIDCHHGSLVFGQRLIRDVHPFDLLSFHDVVVRSSNIGMTRVGARLGKDTLHSYLRRFGFGVMSELQLPGETRGILRSPDDWATVDVATHSFGQGIAVTPLQVVRAVSAIANGGTLPKLRLLLESDYTGARRIISEPVAREVRSMMYDVVEDKEGTGQKAKINGVRVGGKTGTAQKARTDGRGYQEGAYVASFVGFVDGSQIGINRTLTLLVMVDEPNTKSIYGGTLAAPVFSAIMGRSIEYLSSREEVGAGPELRQIQLKSVSYSS